MIININDHASVLLSEHGQRRWKEYHDRLGVKCESTTVLRLPLWEIMCIFGDMCYMGATELPFSGNLIELS